MKIDEKYLKFPKSLPNDLEGFADFYPKKFPPIVDYYEKVASDIVYDPQKFRDYGDWSQKELLEGFEKIKKDYEKGDKDDLGFLVDIDQRFNKLICYRFWVANYIFPDGPIHDFFVTNLKKLIHKFVDVGDDVEDFENNVALIQRDLMQTDYADLYLKDSMAGKKILDILQSNAKTKTILEDVTKLIDKKTDGNFSEINTIWDQIYEIILGDDKFSSLIKEMVTPIEQSEMRNDRLPIYNMLTHSVEFRNENELLTQRFNFMKERIKEIKEEAKTKLSEEEYSMFELSYEQIKNFAMYKDIMGEADPVLLPLWLGEIQVKIMNILIEKGIKIPPDAPHGHASMFYLFVWYLPDELKAKVMTPDFTPFDLKTI